MERSTRKLTNVQHANSLSQIDYLCRADVTLQDLRDELEHERKQALGTLSQDSASEKESHIEEVADLRSPR